MSRCPEPTDAQWDRLGPRLPPAKPPIGTPHREQRAILDGIAWRLRTGAAWARPAGAGRAVADTRPGPRGDPEPEALGRSRGGASAKVRLRATGGGTSQTRVPTPGERHEAGALARRPGRGRPRVRPRRVLGDRGSSGRPHRGHAGRGGLRSLIPSGAASAVAAAASARAAQLRKRVERLSCRGKPSGSLALRDGTRAARDRALWLLGFSRLWLPR